MRRLAKPSNPDLPAAVVIRCTVHGSAAIAGRTMCGLSSSSGDSVMLSLGRGVLLWLVVVLTLCRQGASLRSPIFGKCQ